MHFSCNKCRQLSYTIQSLTLETDMTAQEFVNASEYPALYFRSTGGAYRVAIDDDTSLPFDLSDVTGEVDEDGDFIADNLNPSGALKGYQFKDWNRNAVVAFVIYDNADLYVDYETGD